jgi:hypothetical protein
METELTYTVNFHEVGVVRTYQIVNSEDDVKAIELAYAIAYGYSNIVAAIERAAAREKQA